MTTLNTTEEIIADIHAGKMVIIMDDEDRENEGDLVMAAEAVNADAINFMAKYGRGLICLPMTAERAERLDLRPQAVKNTARFSTAFTVSIEAAEGVTTGISAADRATTILAAVHKDANADDIAQPGHVFPIVARAGGVLTRAGHTEASCDLARLAGFEPAAVIVEILNEDGTMARRPDLEIFAKQHGLKIGTIADLIAYRMTTEKTVAKLVEIDIATRFGEFRLITYQDTIDERLHYAFVKGHIDSTEPTFVRVHVRDELTDILKAAQLSRTWTLDDALARLATESHGVVVVLADSMSENEVILRLNALREQLGEHSESAQASVENSQTLRTYGIGAQILTDIGVEKMRLLSAPMRLTGLAGFKLEVVEYLT